MPTLLTPLHMHAGMAAGSDVVSEALRGAQAEAANSEAPSCSDTAASARAAARAYEHFYSADSAVPSGVLEGYTVWRPRLRRNPPPDFTTLPDSDTDGDYPPLPMIGELSKASSWELAAIDRAAAMLSPAASVTSESELDLSAPPDVQPSDAEFSDDLTARDGPGLPGELGGMEGDIMQAAAASVVQPETSTSGALSYIQSLRQRLLAANTAHTVTAAAAAGVQSEKKWSSQSGSRPRAPKPDVRDEDGHSCPVHWFVADDNSSKIRYISLQVRHCSKPLLLLNFPATRCTDSHSYSFLVIYGMFHCFVHPFHISTSV
jgi:hypothetical protein